MKTNDKNFLSFLNDWLSGRESGSFMRYDYEGDTLYLRLVVRYPVARRDPDGTLRVAFTLDHCKFLLRIIPLLPLLHCERAQLVYYTHPEKANLDDFSLHHDTIYNMFHVYHRPVIHTAFQTHGVDFKEMLFGYVAHHGCFDAFEQVHGLLALYKSTRYNNYTSVPEEYRAEFQGMLRLYRISRVEAALDRL